jgi:hypothetical protein
MTRVPRPLAERFWPRVSGQDDPDACWLWTGAIGDQGYGRIRLPDGRVGYAHRVALELAGIEIPKGLQADHLCETRACVNAAHLEPVTVRENLRRSRDVA